MADGTKERERAYIPRAYYEQRRPELRRAGVLLRRRRVSFFSKRESDGMREEWKKKGSAGRKSKKE